MSGKHVRHDLLIDVGDVQEQVAQVLPQITPLELIAAILEEFSEFEYLGPPAADYILIRHSDQTPLDEADNLQRQVASGDHLALIERQVEPPDGTRPPSKRLYLREKGVNHEQASSKVYKLHWLPAVIGRRGQELADNDVVAVNLSAHSAGLRVSRRHAQISEKNGQFYIESLSSNATIVQTGDQHKTLDSGKHVLQHGDVIYLVRSEIALQFIVRD
jgi:hypothetical protein